MAERPAFSWEGRRAGDVGIKREGVGARPRRMGIGWMGRKHRAIWSLNVKYGGGRRTRAREPSRFWPSMRPIIGPGPPKDRTRGHVCRAAGSKPLGSLARPGQRRQTFFGALSQGKANPPAWPAPPKFLEWWAVSSNRGRKRAGARAAQSARAGRKRVFSQTANPFSPPSSPNPRPEGGEGPRKVLMARRRLDAERKPARTGLGRLARGLERTRWRDGQARKGGLVRLGRVKQRAEWEARVFRAVTTGGQTRKKSTAEKKGRAAGPICGREKGKRRGGNPKATGTEREGTPPGSPAG